MEVLKEFLETSNIDGLFYVATAKVSRMKTLGHYYVVTLFQNKLAKVTWLIVVLLSFLAAGYLIEKSYSN